MSNFLDTTCGVSDRGGSADEPDSEGEYDSDDREAIDDRRLSEISIYSSSEEEVKSLTDVTAGRNNWVPLVSDSDSDSDFEELMDTAKSLSPQFNGTVIPRGTEELPHMVGRSPPVAGQVAPVAVAAGDLVDTCYFQDLDDLQSNPKTGIMGRACKFFMTLNGPELVIDQAADYAKKWCEAWPKDDQNKFDKIFRGWTYVLVVQETGEENGREHLHALVISENKQKRSYKQCQDTIFGGAKADCKVCRNDANACIYLRKGDQPKAEYETLFQKGPTYGRNLRIIAEAGNGPKLNSRGLKIGARDELVATMKRLQEENLMGGQRKYLRTLFEEHGGTVLSAMPSIQKVGNLWVPDRDEGHRTLVFHCGLTGGGKTRSAVQIAKDSGKPYLLLTASGNFCFDNLWNEKILIFDDFRGHHISFSAVLNITDVTQGVEVKARYTNSIMTADEFHFCCPVHPSELWGHLEENLEGKMDQLARRTTEIRVYKAPGPDTVVDRSGRSVLKANDPKIFKTTPSDYKSAWSQSKMAWLEVQGEGAAALGTSYQGFSNPSGS